MKKICKNCQYQREPGAMDGDIPGAGTWCSNSKSPLFRRRVTDDEHCDGFSPRGKKAGVMTRLKVKGLGWLNRKTRK